MTKPHLLDTFLDFNDKDTMTITIIVMFVLIVICCTILAQRIAVNSRNKADLAKEDIDNCPKTVINATIINKIEGENYKDTYFGYPHIVFETATSERIKFAIEDKNLFEHLIVGDQGTLTYAGKAFISFERFIPSLNNDVVETRFKEVE